MVELKSQLFRAGLSALWYSGAARACERWTAGKGAILMLHRVRSGRAPAFAPNARLSISAEYLDALLAGFRAADIDVISLDDALDRVHSRKRTRRFVCFTFDDGYRDNLEHALPVFLRFRAPFTVYATTSFVDRTLAPWWIALEHVIASKPAVRWTLERTEPFAATRAARSPEPPTALLDRAKPSWSDDAGDVSPSEEAASCLNAARRGRERGGPDRAQAGDTGALYFATHTTVAKQAVFAELSARCLRMTAAELSLQLARFVSDHGFSMRELAERDMCSWSELRSLQDAGVEIGCHAVSHARLSCETPETVRDELSRARRLLEAQLGQPVRHLAYPYGKREHVGPRDFAIARELGFASAVTTRAGCVFAAHSGHRHSLPRVEVTPSFDTAPHCLQTIVTGLPLLARNRGRLIISE